MRLYCCLNRDRRTCSYDARYSYEMYCGQRFHTPIKLQKIAINFQIIKTINLNYLRDYLTV